MSTQAVVTMTEAQMKARITELEAQVIAAKTGTRKSDVVFSNGLSVRFNRLGTLAKDGKSKNKGNISLYGFGKFPQSYYLSQWRKLFAVVEEINDAIEAEAAKNTLAVKDEE
jgi:hypothetical protein